jgi:REP element-mobilizing transposase RayT
MKKFRNKYRIQSARLPNWDYGRNGAYFVTICTANRECYFGDVANGEMKFSGIGELANKYWLEIPEHFPFVKLDAHVVMPNHVHGIIIIDKPGGLGAAVEAQNFAPPQSPQPPLKPPQPKNKFGPQSQNLASIIRGYKTGVTKYARINHIDFAWQSRFHDHIIRNDGEYWRIKQYIIDNPRNWKGDSLMQ